MESLTREAEFEQLLEIAGGLYREGSFTVVLKTVRGNFYHAVTPIDPLDFSGEDAMVREMEQHDDTRVKRIVCLNSPTCVGVVSGNLRHKLRSLNERNMEAEILLQGPKPDTYGYRPFAYIFPPAEQIRKEENL